jgi:outer membrane protein assembly factor BamB
VFLGLWSWLGITTETAAQGANKGYWEYSASGRLQDVQLADLDGDGVDELLISDENDRLALVTADGQVLWTVEAPGSIASFTFLNTRGATAVARQIAVAGDGWLLLLDPLGQTIWQHLDEPFIETVASDRLDPELPATVSEIHAYDVDSDGLDEILVLHDSGELIAFNANGVEVWRYTPGEEPAAGVAPLIAVADFDQDGRDEIVLGLFTTRRFSELLYLDEGVLQWQQAVSRRVTTITETEFPNLGHGIAVGTNFGQLNLYDPDGGLVWYRTVNRPITALSYAELGGMPVLAVGTDAGSVITFTSEGQRYWINHLARDANRSVARLLPTTGQTATGQSGLAVLLASASAVRELADVLLLGNNGQTLLQLGSTDLPSITRLVDVNHDNHHELLLARFATLQLIGLGVGNSEYVEDWQYGLDAVPTATLLLDLDRDGEDDILVGTQDGRLHALSSDRSIRWLHAAGNAISALAALRSPAGSPPRIVVTRLETLSDQSETVDVLTWVELRNAQGELAWEVSVPGDVTALAVDERALSQQPAILLGTAAGEIVALDQDGQIAWSQQLPAAAAPITQLLILETTPEEEERILAVRGNTIFALQPAGSTRPATPFARLIDPITAVYLVNQPGDDGLDLQLVVFTTTGLVHGLNRRGVEMSQWGWPFELAEPALQTISAGNGSVEAFRANATAFLAATRDGRLVQIGVANDQPALLWDEGGLDGATALFWDDLDKDGRPDTGLAGTRSGEIVMLEQMNTAQPRRVLDLDLNSSVVMTALLPRTASQAPDLLTVTEDSLIRMFREEENRPPLLTQPAMRVEMGQLSAGVSVTDVENDSVTVLLELFEPNTGTWEPVSQQTLETGNGPLFWPSVTPSAGIERVTYRFRFDDGFYRGYVAPLIGPEVPALPTLSTLTPYLLLLAAIGVIGGVVYLTQYAQSAGTSARRFYRQTQQVPTDTLRLLESKYETLEGSPDFLLQLASLARQQGDAHLAGMSDGLFLLANRPQTGLSIILRTLDEVAAGGNTWSPIEQRQALYRTVYALLEAPSITELTLLRPQLLDVMAQLDRHNEWSPVLDSLLPVLANLRDSERVDAVDDRLVYLNQAAVRLRDLQEHLPEFSPDVERTLTRAIVRRWSGLISAEIEDLRGRAELQISLKTKRIIPNGQTHVAMEIRNSGRAPAENVLAMLEPDAAYHVFTPPQTIAFLPPGRSRQVRFLVEPRVPDRFRVALNLTYDDRNRTAKTQAFGDMVHLLAPVREFSPIANPYVPGTPLRRNSQLFFGREELFEFIREATLATAGRNVLMLVGQRRTGKTSALLRIQEYLPPHLIPVYIDCQALGVTPGMPALLEELAWQIADTLGERGIACELPDHEAWDAEPTRLFQRTFLPHVRSLLPDEAMLLLVFDEFEAFESMVNDGLLPRTLFTYMRHLMQHSVGLSFVFVGTRRLEEMSTDYWSVLFNIALYRKIDFLSDQAATRLITEPVAPQLLYDDLAIDKILRVTAGHPYFLQLVCYTLVKRANQERTGYITISDVNEALDEMLRLGEVHFAYLWQRSSFNERALLTAAAHLSEGNEPLYPEELAEYLQTYGVDLNPAEVTAGLNSLVERDIMREANEEGTTVYELRIGLVGLWVAQNKSLARLLAQTEV